MTTEEISFAEKRMALGRISPQFEQDFVRFHELGKYSTVTLFNIFLAHGDAASRIIDSAIKNNLCEENLIYFSDECRGKTTVTPEDYFDSQIWDFGHNVWRLPIIGHAVLTSDNGTYIRTVPLTLESEEYNKMDFIDLEEDDKLKNVLPPLPGECYIMAYVPDDVPLEQIVCGEEYSLKEVRLRHCCANIDWKPLFREAWLAGVKKNG